jgi:hypothetical protein
MTEEIMNLDYNRTSFAIADPNQPRFLKADLIMDPKVHELKTLVSRLNGRCEIDEEGGAINVYLPATKQQVKKDINGDFAIYPCNTGLQNNLNSALNFVRTWELKWSLKNSVSKVQVKEYVRHKLSTDDKWALAALLKIYSFQTASEKATDRTELDNDVGFSGVDAEILSSIAKQLITRITARKNAGVDPNPIKCLSEKQRSLVRKKMMKYWQQIIDNSDEIKLLSQAKNFHDSNENRNQTRLPL